MSIIRVAVEGVRANDPVTLARRSNTRFATKFITFVCFAFSNAFHLGSMDAVDLILAGASLSEQSMASVRSSRNRASAICPLIL